MGAVHAEGRGLLSFGGLARRLVEVALLLLGALLVVVALLFAAHTIGTPECSVDGDDAGGVLLVRTVGVAWIVLELVLVGVVVTAFRRASPQRWARAGVAAALPAGTVGLWLLLGGALAMTLDLVGAGPGSSACF